MMVPVPFVLWSLGIAFFMFCLLLAFKAVAGRLGGLARAGGHGRAGCGAQLGAQAIAQALPCTAWVARQHACPAGAQPLQSAGWAGR